MVWMWIITSLGLRSCRRSVFWNPHLFGQHVRAYKVANRPQATKPTLPHKNAISPADPAPTVTSGKFAWSMSMRGIEHSSECYMLPTFLPFPVTVLITRMLG